MSFYAINIPVGHAGAPYKSRSQAQAQEPVGAILPFVSSYSGYSWSDNYTASSSSISPSSIDSLGCSSDSPPPHPASFIDKLPFEISLQICNHLPQYDVLSLMRVSSAFLKPSVVRLYRTVVIDKSYSQFNQDVYHNTLDTETTTYIKLKTSLKTFLKVVNQQLPVHINSTTLEHDDPDISESLNLYGNYIDKIQFIDLPDGFYTPFDLNFLSYVSVKNFTNLKHFFWDSETELSFEVINKLSNKKFLKSLHLKLDLKKVVAPQDFESFKEFKNLEKLSIDPVLNSFNLFHMFKNLLDGNDGHLNLRVLRLTRLNSSNGFIRNPSSSLLVLTDFIMEHEPVKLAEYDLNCILNLFILFSAADSKLEKLETLCLDSFVVSTIDAKRLKSIIDLSKLEQLELRNITEVQFPENIYTQLALNELYTRLDSGFLKTLGKNLPNLTRLTIDYRESLRDSVPNFIEKLTGLVELDITIRWNVTKLCSVQSWKHLCRRYINAILTHSTSLKKLSLDTKEDSVFCDLHKLIFTDYLLDLQRLTQLESLRLHGYSVQPYAPLLAANIPKLKYFDLFGSGSGGAPHMGLQVTHDGIFDDWLRVQHVAIAISEQNSGIEFVRIDKCVFEIKGNGNVTPREGLENWFHGKVRVGLNRRDF